MGGPPAPDCWQLLWVAHLHLAVDSCYGWPICTWLPTAVTGGWATSTWLSTAVTGWRPTCAWLLTAVTGGPRIICLFTFWLNYYRAMKTMLLCEEGFSNRCEHNGDLDIVAIVCCIPGKPITLYLVWYNLLCKNITVTVKIIMGVF